MARKSSQKPRAEDHKRPVKTEGLSEVAVRKPIAKEPRPGRMAPQKLNAEGPKQPVKTEGQKPTAKGSKQGAPERAQPGMTEGRKPKTRGRPGLSGKGVGTEESEAMAIVAISD